MTRLRSRRRSPASRRGFTLVELLVAMVAGMLVSMAAFLLAKNASRFFQHEARISSAQLAVTLGMNRLAADLQRAAFLSSPNVQVDPWRCGATGGWPLGLKDLAGIQIIGGGSVAPQSTAAPNNLTPDSLIIGGAFSTTEQFPVRTIVPNGGGVDVYLQTDSGPMVRTLNAVADSGNALGDIFRTGRFLRIVDLEGKQEYGVITGVTQPPGSVIVNLGGAPAIPIKSPVQTCGISAGFNVGVLANPVSRVKYDLRSLVGDVNYGALVAPQSEPMSGDTGRTELVRVELDQDDAEIPSTLELVAEYAVDLKFGITTAAIAPVGGDLAAGSVVRLPIMNGPGNGTVYTIAGKAANAASTPQRIRSVQVRLSTRARAPDRWDAGNAGSDLNKLNPGLDGRRTRFQLASVLGMNYVRMRTLFADITLPNQNVANSW